MEEAPEGLLFFGLCRLRPLAGVGPKRDARKRALLRFQTWFFRMGLAGPFLFVRTVSCDGVGLAWAADRPH